MAAHVYVHTLHFENEAELTRSLDVVLDSSFIEDCLVEPAELRMRFLAPPRSAARVLERIYLHGGMTWCSRHALRR